MKNKGGGKDEGINGQKDGEEKKEEIKRTKKGREEERQREQ